MSERFNLSGSSSPLRDFPSPTVSEESNLIEKKLE